MKKIIQNNLLGFILGIILCSGIVYGVNLYKSEDIQYQPSDVSWEVSNVSDAINSLYSMKTELDNIKSLGDATSSDILEGKTAVVNGKLVTGTVKESDIGIECYSSYIESTGPITHTINLTSIDNYEELKVENMVFDILDSKAKASGTASNGMGFSISYDSSTGIAKLNFRASYHTAENIIIKGYFKVFY